MELELWQSLSIAGLVLLIVEILTPTMFFVNLALACFVTAGVSVYFDSLNILVPVWVVSSAVFLWLLKPLQNRNKGSAGTGMDKYIGQKARVIETIDDDGGVISIFDERWNARSENGEKFTVGSKVYITRNENLTMFVRKEK